MKGVPLARWTGLVLGVGLAAGLVLAGRVPAGGPAAPARLALAAQPTPELGVSPAGRDFLVARLVPGGRPARGALTLSNYTAAPLVARLRLTGRAGRLDRLVRLELRAGGRRVYRGTLGGLRARGGAGLRLGPRRARRVKVSALLPRGAAGFEGRSARLALEWSTETVP